MDLKIAKETLINNQYTCVICRGEEQYTSTFRGVKPLVKWVSEGKDFTGFSAADKVIGKATAFLYVILNVKVVYAAVISQSALKVLEEADIEVEYDTLVEHIINRKGYCICPFETTVLNISAKEEAYEAILAKMKEMNITLE